MTSRISRYLALLAIFSSPLHWLGAQTVTTNTWLGTSDSNYLNAANWSSGTVPDSYTDIVMASTATNRTLNLNYSGTGDATYNVWALQTGVSLGYTLNLSGTSNGWLIYNILGRGTHPYGTDATDTKTGSTATRLIFYLNLGDYSKITFTGSSSLAMASTSGLTYAKITMTGNSVIDASGMTSATGRTTVGIGGLNMAYGTSVNLGAYAAYLNGANLAGEEQTWAGHIYSTSTAQSVNYGYGTTRVTSTGVVDLPGGFLLRYSGTYLVDGTHNGPITSTASSGATLGGTGTINGAVTMSSGTTLAPAGKNAAGTLTINGAVTLYGPLSIDLLSATAYDLLVVNGNLVLGSTSSLAVGISDTFPLVPATYRIVKLNGGVFSGSFGSIVLPSSSWSYAFGADYIDITYIQQAFLAKYPELRGNQRLLASFVDNAIATGSVPAGLVDSLNRKDVLFFNGVVDQLSPAPYYGWFPAAVVRANSLVQTLDERKEQQKERVTGSLESYTMTYRQESSINRNDAIGTDYTNFDTSSVLAGADYAIVPGLIAGGMLNYASTHTDLDTKESNCTTDSFTGALYAQHRQDDLHLQAVGFAGVDKYKSRRNVIDTTLGTWATAKTSGMHIGADVSASYNYRFRWFEVSPLAGLQVLNWRADAFTETGANEASLSVLSQNEMSFSARLGLQLAQSYKTLHGQIRPFVSLIGQHEFCNSDRYLKAILWGQKLTVQAPGIGSQGVRIDAGIDYDLSRRLSMQVRYSITHNGAVDESLGLRGGLNYIF